MDQLFGHWDIADPSSMEIERLEWSVGIPDDPNGPGAGLIDLADGVLWRDGSARSAVFSVSEQFPLVHGQVYVFYVRAWYNNSQYALFESDGVTMDFSGAAINTGNQAKEGTLTDSRDRDFSSDPMSLVIWWNNVFSSALSANASRFEVGVGNVPGSDNIYPLTPVPAREVMATLSGLALESGETYYSMVRASDPLGMTALSISDGILVDTTPPGVGVVLAGRGLQYSASVAQSSTSILEVRWHGFNDTESGIQHYEVALSNSSSHPSPSYADVGVGLRTQLTGLDLTVGQTYYVYVVAVNRAGLRSLPAVSRGVAIQTQRPQGRVCRDTSSQLLSNPSFESNHLFSGMPCPQQAAEVGVATRDWDVNATHVMVAALPQVAVARGCVSIGLVGSVSQHFATLPGRRYLLTFSYTYAALPHRAGVKVQLPGLERLILRPPNAAGIAQWYRTHMQFVAEETVSQLVLSSALSDSLVYIDDVSITDCNQYTLLSSAELAATWPNVIRLDHQVISSSKAKLSALWDVVDVVGGVREYWWAVGTVPGGEQLQPYQSTGMSTMATSTELLFSDGQEVHVTVIAWSNAGMQTLVHSGPYLVDLTPPPLSEHSAAVSDGVEGADVDYQASILLGVNWDGLVDRESGLQQCSWAIGTNVGFSDIQQFLPITTNVTTMTSNLSGSVGHGVRVYSTVVCSNQGGLVSSGHSDGVTVLYLHPESEDAYISISSSILLQYSPRDGYLPSSAMTLRWDGFAEPANTALEYEVLVVESGTGEGNWTALSSIKMLSFSTLHLMENVSHMIQIRAVNLGGVASNPIGRSFFIVSSPPIDSGAAINASWLQETLHLDWSEKFTSVEPLYFELSMGTQMGSGYIRKWVELSVAETSYSVGGGVLERSEDYFVALTAIGSSGLHTTAIQLIAGLPLGM